LKPEALAFCRIELKEEPIAEERGSKSLDGTDMDRRSARVLDGLLVLVVESELVNGFGFDDWGIVLREALLVGVFGLVDSVVLVVVVGLMFWLDGKDTIWSDCLLDGLNALFVSLVILLSLVLLDWGMALIEALLEGLFTVSDVLAAGRFKDLLGEEGEAEEEGWLFKEVLETVGMALLVVVVDSPLSVRVLLMELVLVLVLLIL
jgi:hypothetical protein